MSWFNFVLVLQTCVLVFYPPSCTPMPLQRGTGLISYVLRQQAVAHLQILDFLHTGSKNSTHEFDRSLIIVLHCRPPSFKTKHCEWLASGRECPYGRRCHFKHPTDETLPPSSLHVRAKSWDASLPGSPKSTSFARELGSSNLGKKVLFSWENPQPEPPASSSPMFNKSLSSERDRFVNEWSTPSGPFEQVLDQPAQRRFSGGSISPLQTSQYDASPPCDLSKGLSRLSLSPRSASFARLTIPQPIPGPSSDQSDSDHSSPSKSHVFPQQLGADFGSPRKGPHSPRTTLTVRTSFDGSPRGFEVGRPPYFEPSSPLHHPSYPRAPLSFTEGLSPTRAQAELTDAFKRVKGSTSSYSDRTAQLQLILEALCRRAMSGTELHVRVSLTGLVSQRPCAGVLLPLLLGL